MRSVRTSLASTQNAAHKQQQQNHGAGRGFVREDGYSAAVPLHEEYDELHEDEDPGQSRVAPLSNTCAPGYSRPPRRMTMVHNVYGLGDLVSVTKSVSSSMRSRRPASSSSLSDQYDAIPDTAVFELVPHTSDVAPQSSTGIFGSTKDLLAGSLVGIGFEIRQVKDIDCVSMHFWCDFSILLKWYSPDLQAQMAVGREHSKQELQDISVPMFTLANGVGVCQRDHDISVFADDPPGVATLESMYSGYLAEFMELEDFPLDSQELSIVVRLKDPRLSLRVLDQPDCRVIRESGRELAEWIMYEPEVSVGEENRRSIFTLRMKVYRKSRYYWINVVCTVGAISALAFGAFIYEADDWYSRSNYVATLLLTLVAFRFVLDGNLPKVSFFTLLDVYSMAAFVVMLLLMMSFAAVSVLLKSEFLDPEEGRKLDLTVMGGMASLWLAAQLAYLVRWSVMDMRQRAVLGKEVEIRR